MSKISRTYYYKIDTEGRLWHENSEITDPQVLKFFLQHLETSHEGRLQVMCMGEANWIIAEDVPYVIQMIELNQENCVLHFFGDYQEKLVPQELWVGKDNVLYCKVRNGKFSARFSRKAYWQLSHYIEVNEKNEFFLKLGEQKNKITTYLN